MLLVTLRIPSRVCPIILKKQLQIQSINYRYSVAYFFWTLKPSTYITKVLFGRSPMAQLCAIIPEGARSLGVTNRDSFRVPIDFKREKTQVIVLATVLLEAKPSKQPIGNYRL